MVAIAIVTAILVYTWIHKKDGVGSIADGALSSFALLVRFSLAGMVAKYAPSLRIEKWCVMDKFLWFLDLGRIKRSFTWCKFSI